MRENKEPGFGAVQMMDDGYEGAPPQELDRKRFEDLMHGREVTVFGYTVLPLVEALEGGRTVRFRVTLDPATPPVTPDGNRYPAYPSDAEPASGAPAARRVERFPGGIKMENPVQHPSLQLAEQILALFDANGTTMVDRFAALDIARALVSATTTWDEEGKELARSAAASQESK